MPHIFTYGSLMFDPVWTGVVDCSYDRCEAILHGYDRKEIRGEIYPAIVPSSEHSQVRGMLYLDVSAEDLAKLDRFEGDYYFRKSEPVATRDTAIIFAEVYVLKEEYYPIISHRNWDPVHFRTTGIHLFIHRFTGKK